MDAAEAMQMHDVLLASKPEGARHDADICPFCADKAAQSTTDGNPPSPGAGPDVSDQNTTTSTEGGTEPTMTDISQEAHEALLKKAVDDAVAATEKALSTKTEEAASATSRVAELEKELETEKAESTRLNKELDEAQVKLTAAADEVAEFKAAAKKAEEAQAIAEVASKRTDQVKNLKLFPEEYVAEQASKWATLDDAAWDERLQEWAKLKPATTEEGKGDESSDAASAMTGTSEELTKEQQDAAAAGGTDTKTKSRRAVLGLV